MYSGRMRRIVILESVNIVSIYLSLKASDTSSQPSKPPIAMSELLDIITEVLLNIFGRILYTPHLANISL